MTSAERCPVHGNAGNARQMEVYGMKFSTALGLATVLGTIGMSAGCTKTPEEKKADVAAEANHDINEVKKEANQDINEIQKDAAEDQREINKDAREDRVDAAKDHADDQRDVLVKQYDDRLSALDDRLGKLEDKVDDKTSGTQNAVAPTVADAKAKREAANTQLKALKDNNALAWADLKPNVEASFTELEAAISKAESDIAAH